MNPGMPYLLLSCCTEAVWNICLKRSKGLRDWPVNLIGVCFMIVGVLAFKKSLSNISLSVATVIWSGTSLVLTIILDTYLHDTKLDNKTIFFIFLCMVSIIGLNFSSKN
ncbi:MAG: hypothetical protein JST82_01135 [Bacteroidetes bacterium]|nr:hypothetical protein [Bacteroidota bacterium]